MLNSGRKGKSTSPNPATKLPLEAKFSSVHDTNYKSDIFCLVLMKKSEVELIYKMHTCYVTVQNCFSTLGRCFKQVANAFHPKKRNLHSYTRENKNPMQRHPSMPSSDVAEYDVLM